MSAIPTNVVGAVARRGANSSLRVSSRSRIVIPSYVHYTPRRCMTFSAVKFQPWKLSGVPEKHLQSRQYQQRRKISSEDQPLKQVGFEDVNTKITSSPSSTPSNIILVDVREPAELSATGIIPGAVSIPLASQPDAYFLPPDEFETRFGYPKPGFEATAEGSSDPNKEQKEIIFYCKAGVRANAAAQLAVQAGYDPQTISVYYGSWLDWTDNGGKVEKWEGNGEEMNERRNVKIMRVGSK